MFESDPEVILAAVMRQSAHLKTYQLGQHAALTQKLLNEVSAAKVCLLDPQRKAAYDARLRKELEAKKTPARPQTLPTAKPLSGPSPAPSPVALAVRIPPTADSCRPRSRRSNRAWPNCSTQIEDKAAPSHPKAKKQAAAGRFGKGRSPGGSRLACGNRGAAILAGGIFAAMLIVRVRRQGGQRSRQNHGP